MKTKSDKKLFTSIGPWEIYYKLAMLTFYTPYWRKVARMLNTMRRMNHCDFSGDSYNRMVRYARSSYKDTQLPDLVKEALRSCIDVEFKFDIDPR